MSLTNRLVVMNNAQPTNMSWDEMLIIGDGMFSIPWHYDKLADLKREYALEALHNTVGAWIDYRPWLKYPDEWDVNIRRLIDAIHDAGLPAGVAYGFHVGDSVNSAYDEQVGFLHYYRVLIDEKWKYPNGTISPDPYSVGASKSFSGLPVFRIFGEPHEIELYQRVDFTSTMQPQNPYWLRFFAEWGKNAIDRGADTFFIDNPDGMFVFFWGGGWGCADTWEGRGFINYLKSKFIPEELRKLGVTNIENFCLRDYLVSKYKLLGVSGNYIKVREKFVTSWPYEIVHFENVDEIMGDPLVKAALLYWYKAMHNFTRSYIENLKSYAKSNGKSILVTVNQYFSWIPHITLTPFVDIIYVETNQFIRYPLQTNSFICKMALPAGNYSKKVWIGEHIMQFTNPYSPGNPPSDISNFIKIQVAEHFASGCVRLVPLGTGWYGESWPPQRLIVGSERTNVSKYYRFIANNREFFTNVRPYSNVALLVSLPTAIWNYIPALGVFRGGLGNDYQKELWGWARLLENLGIQYDVLMLGMKEIFSTDSISRLSDYDLIIAPMTSHVSEEDFRAILSYLLRGGKLITTINFASYDDVNNPRNVGIIEKVLNNSNVFIVDNWMGMRYLESIKNGKPDTTLKANMEKAIMKGLKDRFIFSAEKPENVLVTVQYQPNRGRFIIHLVNYNYRYDSQKDYLDAVNWINLSLNIPKPLTPRTAYLLSPDFNSTIKLEFSFKDHSFNVRIPRLDVWDIVVLELELPTVTKTAYTTLTETITTQTVMTTTKTITEVSERTITVSTKEYKFLTTTQTITSHKILTTTTTIIVQIEDLLITTKMLVGIMIGVIITLTIVTLLKYRKARKS
jgi:hypothetical protein